MSQNQRIFVVSISLTLATLIAFWQVKHCDFINYDDQAYVNKNSHIQNGLTIDGIRWAFTTGYQGNWHPLTWMSHMLDVELFGLRPWGHHLTNLLLHIANTLLLFFVFQRMTRVFWQSTFVAALFALHPLHVESVAWVAERKDVLSALFWMLTMGAYCFYVERPNLLRYLTILLLFILGLMAKPMLVTLPFVLLLLDYWPLRRFDQERSNQEIQTKLSKSASSDNQKRKSRKGVATIIEKEVKPQTSVTSEYRWEIIRHLLWEKTPFFAMAAISSLVTYITQQGVGAVQSIQILPLSGRISNALVSYIAYIGKTIWPNNLAYFYPYPKFWQPWQVLGAALVVIAITLLIILNAKRFQYLTVGWLWYIGTLVPVIGFVQVGSQARADRYTYIPLIGLFIMTVWGIPVLLKKWRYRNKVLIASSTLTLSGLFIVTWIQVGYWQNSLTLSDHALKVTNYNYAAYCNRGNAYKNLGNYSQAIVDYDKAIELDPAIAEAYYCRGNAYVALGNEKQAIEDYDRAIEINPTIAEAYINRAYIYVTHGNEKQAIEDANRAIEINPTIAEAYIIRGNAYKGIGNDNQAIVEFDRAIEINPKFAKAYNNRGNTYASLGNYKQAILDYDRAIDLDPAIAEVYHNRGNVYAALGNYKQAIVDYDKAIEVDPKIAGAYLNLGIAYAALGNPMGAIVEYDKAIGINPKFALAYRHRAVSYARLGNTRQAIQDVKTAAILGDKIAQNLLKGQGINRR